MDWLQTLLRKSSYLTSFMKFKFPISTTGSSCYVIDRYHKKAKKEQLQARYAFQISYASCLANHATWHFLCNFRKNKKYVHNVRMVPFSPAMLEIIMTSNDHESLMKIYVNTYQNIYLQAPFQYFEAGSLELLLQFSKILYVQLRFLPAL